MRGHGPCWPPTAHQVVAGLGGAGACLGVLGAVSALAGTPAPLAAAALAVPCLWPALVRLGTRVSGGRGPCARTPQCGGTLTTSGLLLRTISPTKQWSCCRKARDSRGCGQVCLGAEGALCNGRREWEGGVRWGSPPGCVYIGPPGELEVEGRGAVVYMPGVAHEL